ncbi:MAG: Single-stranded DNA-binding protein [Candidatus Roizmanbacteria bacterium GW2011_GWA2_34_18]|uniref:Single-stranded DNA-binding protein n=1 Tax=Candidatus Roizmanbacteria bacterium GW2011_GWA2_34_18 TaxID=1618477 RepID=A0A0G0AW48_9BACT|nr:MAG: Single-stranded DNA-binding protein [Candidatus Roizmanbacteria bacterium GW2011_GWA2_34_18]
MSSRSLNRIVLIGNLTRDPELKYTPTGTAVCTFGIATNRSWTTNDGQTKEDVQYHRIVAWQKLAELCGKILNKGRKVFVEGRMTYRTFTGKDGIQRTIAEIVLDDFIVFGDGRKMTENVQTTPTNEVATTKTEENKTESTKDETVNPDDIPF